MEIWRQNRRAGQARAAEAAGRSYDYIPAHQLPTPTDDGELVLIENRPHRDYYFPVTGNEVVARLRQLPADEIEGITHVWLRRMRPSDLGRPLGSYTSGPGFAVITLYPWPRDRTWPAGRGKPHRFWVKHAARFDGRLVPINGTWYAVFSEEGARRFFLDDLILHEVGHHNDWRWSSPANHRQCEEFADQYAARWARKLAQDES